jgi:hypothetical protein
MNWGKAITLSFILFAGFILSIVFMMMRQRVDLVREDYYKEEINYEKQLSRIKNTKQIPIKMQYSTQNQQIKIVLPSLVKKGEILFFRPSDKNLDFKKNLGKESIQNFDTSQMAKGSWKIQVYWTDGRYDYFKEEELFIQ